jgi:ABC-2 type transport system ATP-binding protein
MPPAKIQPTGVTRPTKPAPLVVTTAVFSLVCATPNALAKRACSPGDFTELIIARVRATVRRVVAPLVRVVGLTKQYYGQSVLSKVSFDIARGEVFGYIGPNGAGKTTTLKILAGLIRKYEGEVTVAGMDVLKDRAKAHSVIGYQPQSAGFQNWRTVESALDTLGALSGVPAETRKRRIPELLERFGLAAARTKKVKELSGGMTQKVGLIQALLHEPDLLVLDEPLEGLDPPGRHLLKDIIRERQRAGTTVLFSSHILSDVEDVADRVGILNAGKLEISGSIRDLATSFGLPTEIDVDYAVAPDPVPFMDAALGTAIATKPNRWRIVVPTDGDPDAIIHTIIERSLAAGGRVRHIGVAAPELDDLFAQYVNRGAARA